MSNSAVAPTEGHVWPLTREAWDRLLDEIGRLHEDLSSVAGQGLEEGICWLPVARAAGRLETLKSLLDRCRLVDDTGCAAIGGRATVLDAEGVAMSYEIVLPGDGDPGRGCIPADSPLGVAILGAQAGDVVEVTAPAGPRRAVTVVSVD